LQPTVRDTEERQRAGSRDQAEKWLAALVQVAQNLRPGSEPQPTQGVTAAWRSGDEPMTMASATSVIRTGSDTQGEAVDRLVVRVGAGDLGELELVLCRGANGVRVFIGTESENLAQTIAPEQATLLRALENVGLRVESLAVGRPEALGSFLASRRTVSAPRTRQRTATHNAAIATPRRARKLNLVG
jgi:hypothetical protein